MIPLGPAKCRICGVEGILVSFAMPAERKNRKHESAASLN